MKNVLVFPCGSEIGLEINRALSYSTHFKLFGASSIEDHGRFVYRNYIKDIPLINDLDFIDEINKVIVLNNIDFIIPAHDSAVLKMAENRKLIKAVVVTSPYDTCKICRSKSLTYNIFYKKLPVPKLYNIGNKFEFPIFLKPDIGQGSKGTFKVNTEEEISFYYKKDKTLIALEYLPGKEYTVDCFTNKDGKLLFAEGRERKRISNGISVNSKQVFNPKFQEFAETINKTLVFQGVWFYQVKERLNGELVLMEIAPRIAGTMALFRAEGVNFIQMNLFDLMGIDVSILYNQLDIEIDRALFARYLVKYEYENVYIDFDDTITNCNSVNSDIIKFLYQARNEKKKIILISRHKENISETFKKYAISEFLFDEIIIIKQDEMKSEFVKHTNSIFIDDSFSERKDVFESKKIPVFSQDSIESLLNWKV